AARPRRAGPRSCAPRSPRRRRRRRPPPRAPEEQDLPARPGPALAGPAVPRSAGADLGPLLLAPTLELPAGKLLHADLRPTGGAAVAKELVELDVERFLVAILVVFEEQHEQQRRHRDEQMRVGHPLRRDTEWR